MTTVELNATELTLLRLVAGRQLTKVCKHRDRIKARGEETVKIDGSIAHWESICSKLQGGDK